MTQQDAVQFLPGKIAALPAIRVGWGSQIDSAPFIRALDVVVALVALVAFAPLMLMIAALIYFHDGGSPIFSHRRVGFGGRSFPCLKFRSMVMDADVRLRALLASDPEARAEWDRDQKLRKDPRITRLGHFLRKSSLDELPQLINVLRGEMSIVGPRPIVDAEVVRYGRRFGSYCAVRPGITGLWQVSGRNDTTYRRRVALDHVYSQRNSLGLYVWVLVATVPVVLFKRGSY